MNKSFKNDNNKITKFLTRSVSSIKNQQIHNIDKCLEDISNNKIIITSNSDESNNKTHNNQVSIHHLKQSSENTIIETASNKK